LKWKKILEINSKIYPFDLWIRNSVVWFDLLWDIEKFLELVVLNYLLLNWYTVKVGVFNEKEIDFIAEKNWKKIYIQVVYLLSSEKVINREFWNLLEIQDNYEKIVLSLDEFPVSDYKWVKYYNIIDYLLEE
jgi:predicted AAA+ superfamily ATPase